MVHVEELLGHCFIEDDAATIFLHDRWDELGNDDGRGVFESFEEVA